MFCVKRLMIALATVTFIRPIAIPIFVYVKLSVFTIGHYITHKPMNSKVIQIMDSTNETFILLSGYALIIFSNWTYNPDIEYGE